MRIQPVSKELIGEVSPNDYFKEHFAEYEQEFLDAICARGYPRELWPSNAQHVPMTIHTAKKTGMLPRTVQTSLPMEHDNYVGAKPHELVAGDFQKTFGMLRNALFVITDGEDWWPYDHSFMAHNANSFMLYCLYQRARTNKDVLAAPKKRGRPRNEEAHAAKTERGERYQQWLADCEVYRVRLNELKSVYMHALKEYTEHKEQGAPKWIP